MQVLATIREVFSERLKGYRGKRTVRAMAQFLDVEYGTYRTLEDGVIPQGATLTKIAKRLGIPETELFNEISPTARVTEALVRLGPLNHAESEILLSVIRGFQASRIPSPPGNLGANEDSNES